MQVVRKLTRESLQNDCIVSVGTELDIWLYRTHVRSYNLAANAGIAVSFAPMLIYSWHFHGQKYGIAKNASIRNHGDAYENLSRICVTGNNGFVESAWMFSFFLQCDVYWMTGPPFLCESASIDKATSLWRLLIEVADGWFGKDRFVCFRTTCMSGFRTYCWMSMR